MEDYLQLDEWKPNKAKPGKKTVSMHFKQTFGIKTRHIIYFFTKKNYTDFPGVTLKKGQRMIFSMISRTYLKL